MVSLKRWLVLLKILKHSLTIRSAFRGLLYWRNIIFCVGLVFLLLDEVVLMALFSFVTVNKNRFYFSPFITCTELCVWHSIGHADNKNDSIKFVTCTAFLLSILAYFHKIGLCDLRAVCVSVYPLLVTFEYLNQSSLILVCISWHLSPS
jgi:hypothetical protein